MLTAILTLAGVIVGAVLSPWVAYKFARQREAYVCKREAYLTFMSAVAAISNADQSDETNLRTAEVALRTANLAVCLHGSQSVVEKLSELMKYENLRQTGARVAFTNLVTTMRRDLAAKDFPDDAHTIGNIVFLEHTL